MKWKKLAGGGYFKIINKSIPLVLERLGYAAEQIDEIILTFLVATHQGPRTPVRIKTKVPKL